MGFVVQKAKAMGYNVVEVANQADVWPVVEHAIATQDPLLVIGVGHGESNRFTGWLNEIIFHTDTNEAALSNRIVYLLACVCAKELGPSIIANGGTSFMGFSDYFLWATQDSENPVDDKFAQPFMEINTKIAFDLLEGKTTGQAYRDAVVLSDLMIDKWAVSTDKSAPMVVQFLLHNKSILKCLGNRMARV